jgi:hypothetical protein
VRPPAFLDTLRRPQPQRFHRDLRIPERLETLTPRSTQKRPLQLFEN